MLKRTIIYCILILFIRTVSYSQNAANLSGKWVSEKDKLNIIVFKGGTLYQYYDDELEEKGSFFLGNNCKVKNVILNQNKPVFLNEVNPDNSITCNEIVSLTKNRLTLMYSENGKITAFIKQKSVKRKS